MAGARPRCTFALGRPSLRGRLFAEAVRPPRLRDCGGAALAGSVPGHRAFEQRFGRRFEDVYPDVLAETLELGLVERENGRLRLTDRGRYLANEVFVRLLPD